MWWGKVGGAGAEGCRGGRRVGRDDPPHPNPIFTIKLTRSNKDDVDSRRLVYSGRLVSATFLWWNQILKQTLSKWVVFYFSSSESPFQSPYQGKCAPKCVCVWYVYMGYYSGLGSTGCRESPFVFCRFHLPDRRAPLSSQTRLLQQSTCFLPYVLYVWARCICAQCKLRKKKIACLQDRRNASDIKYWSVNWFCNSCSLPDLWFICSNYHKLNKCCRKIYSKS